MTDTLAAGDVGAARRLLPSLCGRDPDALDADGLTRAALESLAENTSDAQVAPLLVDGGRRRPGSAGLSGSQHARCDGRLPLTEVCPIRLGRSAIGRLRQLRAGPVHRRPGGHVRSAGRGIADGCGPGLATRRGTAPEPERRGGRGGVRRRARRSRWVVRPDIRMDSRSVRLLVTGPRRGVDDLRRAVAAVKGGAGGGRWSWQLPSSWSAIAIRVRATEHTDDSDASKSVVDSVDDAVGTAASTVAIVQWWP